jgi:hypothetical protein
VEISETEKKNYPRHLLAVDGLQIYNFAQSVPLPLPVSNSEGLRVNLPEELKKVKKFNN